MAETNGETGKRTVLVTGGTGLVGSGIKEFVSTDKEVRSSLRKVCLLGYFVARFFVVILCKQVFQLLCGCMQLFSLGDYTKVLGGNVKKSSSSRPGLLSRFPLSAFLCISLFE